LAEAAYLPLEDELSRGYILTAITKLHAAIDFVENPKIEAVMYDYSYSKHTDV
jgi:hypothetical protein